MGTLGQNRRTGKRLGPRSAGASRSNDFQRPLRAGKSGRASPGNPHDRTHRPMNEALTALDEDGALDVLQALTIRRDTSGCHPLVIVTLSAQPISGRRNGPPGPRDGP